MTPMTLEWPRIGRVSYLLLVSQDQERKKEKANRGSESGPVGGLWPQPMGVQGWETCPVDRPSEFSKGRKMTRKCWPFRRQYAELRSCATTTTGSPFGMLG